MSSVLLVGAGHMGGALLKGWIASGIGPIAVIEPQPSERLRELVKRKAISLVSSVDGLGSVRNLKACVVALKPQILEHEAHTLRPIAETGATMISIAAGTSIATLRKAWGRKAAILRAMPNMPGGIGKGITVLYAGRSISAKQRAAAETLLAALGKTLWISREAQIDAVTAVSGSGPAYVFALTEALEAAARKLGLPREKAALLARQTVIGAGALLEDETASAAELRRAVASPGGTTEAALKTLLARGGLGPLLEKTVAAAYARARELSRSTQRG